MDPPGRDRRSSNPAVSRGAPHPEVVGENADLLVPGQRTMVESNDRRLC
jgi:hypothetical protein